MTPTPAPGSRGRFLFLPLFACSSLTTLVAVVFFVIGLGDGSVSSFNLALWLGLLCVMALSLWAGYAWQARGKVALAMAALAITAGPGILAALYVLVLLVMQPQWN